MAFTGSMSYLAAGQVSATLPLMFDGGGNATIRQCYFSHFQVSPAPAVSVQVSFDNSTTQYIALGAPTVFAIPAGAKVMTITPTGGSASVELGKA